jgi:hypothetical membrane protein
MKNKRLIRMLSLSGILASILNSSLIIALDLTVPDYNSITQYVSEYGTIPGVISKIVSAWWIISGIMLMLFSFALNNAMQKSGRFSFVGPLCICLYGLMDSIGSAIFPMDTADVTFSGIIHILVSFIGITAVIFSPLALVNRMKKDPVWSNLVCFAWVTQICFLLIYIVCVLAFADIYFSKYAGILQRVFILEADIWMAVLGFYALKALKAPDNSHAAEKLVI